METIKVVRDGQEVEITLDEFLKGNEEVKRMIQSESSKAKGEILKTIGVTSVEEAKTKLSAGDKVASLEEKLLTLEKDNAATRNKLYATELGVKPELVDKVIILAGAAMADGKDFKEIMRAEAEAIGALVTQAKQGPQKQGVSKSKEELDIEKAEREEMKRLASLDPLNR